MIVGFVKGQELRLRYPKLASDTDKYQRAEFRFQGHDWDGAEVWAHFSLPDKAHLKILLESGYAGPEKKLNFTEGVWDVYLEGKLPNGGTITTLIAKMDVGPTGPLTGDGSLPEKPPTEFEQLIQQATDAKTGAETAQRGAEAAAQEAKAAADGVKDIGQQVEQVKGYTQRAESASTAAGSYAVDAAGSAKSAQDAAALAKADATFVMQAATDAAEAAKSAKGSMDAAALSAQQAGRDAGIVSQDVQSAEQATVRAGESATAAAGHADRAVQAQQAAETAANDAGGSAGEAASSAQSAKSEADRAKEEADRAQAGATGVTKEQAEALDTMLRLCVYTKPDVSTEYTAFRKAWGLDDTSVPTAKITLDRSELAIVGRQPVTLVAAVEPPDSTEAVVWSSSAPSVATVSGGVVNPVGNGDTVVTATSGSQKATCTVNVSGFDAGTPFGVKWTDGLWITGGKEYENAKITTSDFVPVDGKTEIVVTKQATATDELLTISSNFYDSKKVFIKKSGRTDYIQGSSAYPSPLRIPIPSEAAFIREAVDIEVKGFRYDQMIWTLE